MTNQIQISEDDRKLLFLAWSKDPILCARQLFGHWFPRPMPWFHRGMIAIMLRRADFLLNFGDEIWPDGRCKWTKKLLMKLVRNFRYRIDPKNVKSPTAPIFIIRWAEDGRTPVGIDMAIGNHICEIIPRGFSKTTICNFGNTYKCLYKLTTYTVYISESATHSKDQIATIKRELVGNELLIAVFGNLRPNRTDDEVWGAEYFETTTGVKFASKGSGSQIRGQNKFAERPDTIVLDDVEDREEVKNEVLRKEKVGWMVSDVMEALPRGRPGQIIILGTILHPEALLLTIAKDKNFTTIWFGALVPTGEMEDTGQLDENGEKILKPILEPLWDDIAGLTLEQIEAKRISFAEKGKLDEFGREILSEIRDEDTAKFGEKYWKYKTLQRSDFLHVALHIDPAISGRPNADFCSLAVVGLTHDGRKHVLEWRGKQGVAFSEQAHWYWEMHFKWTPNLHSVESTAYQAALAQTIREQMFQKAKEHGAKAYFEIQETYPSTQKVPRVEGILEPLFKSGYLTFQQVWPELETMFRQWPLGKLDGPDSIAGAISNFEPWAALSYGDSDKLETEYNSDDNDYEAPCRAGSNEVP